MLEFFLNFEFLVGGFCHSFNRARLTVKFDDSYSYSSKPTNLISGRDYCWLVVFLEITCIWAEKHILIFQLFYWTSELLTRHINVVNAITKLISWIDCLKFPSKYGHRNVIKAIIVTATSHLKAKEINTKISPVFCFLKKKQILSILRHFRLCNFKFFGGAFPRTPFG